MKTNSNYQIQIISSPRWKNIQVITFNNGDIWINLNDLCRICRTTTTSALNSLRSQQQYVHYFPCNNEEASPFIDINGIECANFFRSNHYMNQIADWIELELKTPILPKPSQITNLRNPKSIIQPEHPCPMCCIEETDTENYEPIEERITFYDGKCDITRLCYKFNKKGIDYTPQEFRQWLIIHQYISHAKAHLYRPLNRWYDKGYFYDNRKTFNSFYPQRDLIFTPKGQEYFYKKLKKEKRDF